MPRMIVVALLLALCSGCGHHSSIAAPPPPPGSDSPTPAPPPAPALQPPPPPPAATPAPEEPRRVTAAKPPTAADVLAPGQAAGGGTAPPRHHAAKNPAAVAAGSQPAARVNTPAAPAAEPTQDDHINSWFNQLKQGAIEYKVPPKMVWNVGSTVSVTIHGYQSPPTPALPGATGSGTLKVSDRMKVRLLCLENPDEFAIVDEDGAGDTRFVPTGGTTTWRWLVTPKFPAKGQKLTIQAWTLYPGQDDKYAEELPVYIATLDVDASLVKNAERGFWSDPGNWVKYMLPGGAGFIFLAGIVAWFMKRFSKKPAEGGK